jgi:NADPH-dependent 2,4-dienoyl-CoA reductase/sulfur reductase-like enzyme
LSDGSVIHADRVVVGIGVRPATDWLAGAGLVLDDGVVCDETLSAAPGVVAAGDVARWPSRRAGRLMRVEHWDHAIASGEAAARRLLAGPDAEIFDPVPWFWSDQHDMKIQLVGFAGPDLDSEVVSGSFEEDRVAVAYGRGGVLVGMLGINRPRHVALMREQVTSGVSFADGVAAARAL